MLNVPLVAFGNRMVRGTRIYEFSVNRYTVTLNNEEFDAVIVHSEKDGPYYLKEAYPRSGKEFIDLGPHDSLSDLYAMCLLAFNSITIKSAVRAKSK